MNADVLRLLLVFFLIAIFLVAFSYLLRRKMSCWAYAFWGSFALLLPAFGPFFVIAYRPGERREPHRGCNKKKVSHRNRKSELS